MFGRRQQPTAQTADAPTVHEDDPRPGGKGRPTPKRREAEQANRKPLVGTARKAGTRAGASKDERRQAKADRRQAASTARARALAGDERYLGERDRGPVRRFVRDYVDARFNLGEFTLPVLLIVLMIGLIANDPRFLAASTYSLWLWLLLVALDLLILARRVRRAVAAKFGPEATEGIGRYAALRAFQMRRARRPAAQVKRGQHPA